MIASIDPVNLLCDLIEASVGSLEVTALPDRWGGSIDFLSNIGAITTGELLSVLTCRACDGDHPVRLEFDPRTRRHWHFCPEAGRVMVEDDVLATIRVDPEWVLDWLVTALPITPPVRRRVLVPALAWHLGDAHIGGAELTVVFAIGVSTQRNLDALAIAVLTVPPAKFGIVLTTSGAPPRRLRLPLGYQFLDLQEIARPEKDYLVIEKTKLVGWIKRLRKGLDKPAQLNVGRRTRRELAGNLGVGLSTLTRWIARNRDREIDAPEKARSEDMTTELKRLRRENEILRQERDSARQKSPHAVLLPVRRLHHFCDAGPIGLAQQCEHALLLGEALDLETDARGNPRVE
jgi:transposase